MIQGSILKVKITKQVKWGFCLKYSPIFFVFLIGAPEDCGGNSHYANGYFISAPAGGKS